MRGSFGVGESVGFFIFCILDGAFSIARIDLLKKDLKDLYQQYPAPVLYTLRSGTGCTWYWYPRNILTVFETFIKISFPGLRFVRLICVSYIAVPSIIILMYVHVCGLICWLNMFGYPSSSLGRKIFEYLHVCMYLHDTSMYCM